MTPNDNMNDINGSIPPNQTNAVSVYSDAMDDFPVLKAFQQYVDAEQAKAHKRLMTVCVFFTIVMTIVIAVFMFIILGLDKGNAGNDAAFMALAESNAAIQRQMLEQSSRMNEQLMRELANRSAAPQTPAPSPLDAQIQKQNLDLQAKLHELELEKRLAEKEAADAKQRAEKGPSMTDAEKFELEQKLKKREAEQKEKDEKLKKREARIADESKRLKEKEIDLQRRKLYPDAYSPEAREKANREIEEANRKSKEAEEKARAAEERALLEIRRIEAEKKALEKRLVEAEARADATEAERYVPPAKDDAVTPIKPTRREIGAKPVVQSDGTLRFFDDEEDETPKRNAPPSRRQDDDSDLDEFDLPLE